MKTMRRKKSQTMVKYIEPKERSKDSTKGGGKKTSHVLHMIHLPLIGIL